MLEQPIQSEVLTMEQSSELVNQQGTSLSWMAGFVDGEGTLTFTCDWKRGVYSPYFQVCNTSFIAFDKCKEILDYHNIRYHVRTQKLNKNWKIVWKISCSNYKQVLNIIKLLFPYLIVKKRQAELIQKFSYQRIKNPQEEYTTEQLSIIRLVKELNQRGPSETLHLPFPKKDKDKVQT